MSAHEQALIIKGYLTALNAPSHILAGIDIILNEVMHSNGSVSVKIPVKGCVDDWIDRFLTKKKQQTEFQDTSGDHHCDAVNVGVITHSTHSFVVPDKDDTFKKEAELSASSSEHKTEEKSTVRRKLTDDDKRQIVHLKENEKKKWSEIAQTIGCKKETAYSWYANHASIGDLQIWRSQKKADFVPIPPDKIIADHDEYIGQRDPGQKLSDKDWPDIQRMLQKGKNIRTLAKDYNVDRTVMDVFVDKHLLADARKKDANSRGPRPLKLDDIEPLEETDF